LGSKNTLQRLVHEITTIPHNALEGEPLSNFPVDERLRWAARRDTKRTEDRAYCLLGIFKIFMPLLYGEGDNAFVRLRDEIYKPSSVSEYDTRKRRELLKSLPSLDFDIKHETVHHECLTGTGQWFLELEVVPNMAREAGNDSMVPQNSRCR